MSPNPALAAFLVMLWFGPLSAQETAFVYQGELIQSGAPANGLYDFQVSLYDTSSGGAPLAPDEVLVNESVSEGVFFLPLDFGASILTAPELWLEIQVREAGQPDFTLLTPRWRVSPAAQAAYATVAGFDSVDSDSISPQSIGGSDMAQDAIDRPRIAIDAVQTQHIQDGAIGSAQFAPSSVGLNQIAFDAVGSDELATDAVTAAKIAANAVGSSEIADNSVGSGEIADDGISSSVLAPNSVSSTKIADNAVGASELAGGAVGQSDINSNEVQTRITGSCLSGQSMRSISASGTVQCEGDSRGLYSLGQPFVAETLPVASFGNGIVEEDIGPLNSRLCWLSFVLFDDLDNSSENARCRVYVSGNRWMLQAFVPSNRDGTAQCNALCASLFADP